MSDNKRRLLWNTRERLLSSDMNAAFRHVHRHLTEVLLRSRQGTGAQHTGFTQRESGVISGFICRSAGTDMNVDVSPGLALKSGAGGSDSEDSDFGWFEQLEEVTIDTTTYQDGTNPRWICIEIDTSSSADQVESSESRDIFGVTLGTFTPSNVDKQRGPNPTLAVRSGAATATPVFPVGGADRIPLAYVLVPSSPATAIPSENIVLCRPILDAAGSDRSGSLVVGGGVNVAAGGNNIIPAEFSAAEAFIPFVVGVDPNTINISGTDAADTFKVAETYPPGGAQVISVYAATAPYPTGYDADLCLREFQTDPTGPFGAVVGNNCVIAFSTSTAPPDTTLLDGDGLAGSALAGSVWNGGTVQKSWYLGSIIYDGTDIAAQIVSGAGKIHLTEAGNQPSESSIVSGGGGGGTGNLRQSSPLTPSGNVVLPTTAFRYDVILDADGDGAGDFTASITDNAGAAWLVTFPDASADQQHLHRQELFSSDGAFAWTHSNASGGSAFTVRVQGYTDRILSNR